MFRVVCDLSRILHSLLFSDHDQSLCARAWMHRGHWFWRAWVALFGRRHCERSFNHYHGKADQ